MDPKAGPGVEVLLLPVGAGEGLTPIEVRRDE